MTAVRKKSKVPELNEAKLGLVKLADSGKQWLTNVSFRTVSKLHLSIKAPVCQWLSESVWMFPNSSETANPSDLKFWGMIPLGMEKVLG